VFRRRVEFAPWSLTFSLTVRGLVQLVSPLPFNAQPSKTFPSGGVSAGALNVLPVRTPALLRGHPRLFSA
jgi:hypothetical protein